MNNYDNADANMNSCKSAKYTYVDLFAGCGGLSLGLMNAGWEGLFAIESDGMAFETLKHNLITCTSPPKFRWPSWLPIKPHDVTTFSEDYESELAKMQGTVTLVAGGPPCQGFSLAGRRDVNDERNRLFENYLRIVRLLAPRLVLLENVHGITIPFPADTQKIRHGGINLSIAEEIAIALDELGYQVYSDLIDASEYGVPQSRSRYILIALRADKNDIDKIGVFEDLFSLLSKYRNDFLTNLGLATNQSITAQDAISDLERQHGEEICTDHPRFHQGLYGSVDSNYQRLMKVRRNGTLYDEKVPDSHRFANHRDQTVKNFKKMMQCKRGVQLSHKDRERLGVGKHVIVPLAANEPCHTLTTLPDDCLHYSEPRIFTVREYARIQSFPDWFEFRGKYTTGGKARKTECPRYTQVGNAVPPLLGEALGLAFKKFLGAVTRAYQSECKTQGAQESTVVRTE